MPPVYLCHGDENDCGEHSTCTHTGPGSHECTCFLHYSGQYGQNCAEQGVAQCLPDCTLQVLCPALPPLDGASISYSNGMVAPSVATYTCDASGGPPNDGDATRTCQDDGTWSGVAPALCQLPRYTCGDFTSVGGLHPRREYCFPTQGETVCLGQWSSAHTRCTDEPTGLEFRGDSTIRICNANDPDKNAIHAPDSERFNLAAEHIDVLCRAMGWRSGTVQGDRPSNGYMATYLADDGMGRLVNTGVSSSDSGGAVSQFRCDT